VLAAFGAACWSCTMTPHQRELGADRMDPVEIAERAFRDLVDESPPPAQPLEGPQESVAERTPGPIRKESIGAQKELGRGFEERDPHPSSRRNFIDMYGQLLEDKHALDLSVQALRKRVTALEAELAQRDQAGELTSRELEEARAARKLLEDALAAAQKKADEMYDRYVEAEEKRLQNEIQLVRLQHELVKNGIEIPPDLVSKNNEGK
jgi:hypothetical protein